MSSFEQNNNDLSLADIHHEVLLQLEAIIFASEAPVSIARLKEAFNNQYNKQQLRQLLQQLALLQHGRSIELIETAQGFRFQVRSKYRNIIAQIWPERPTKLSPSLLETLAVIAYHQPVTRADIEQIRGVSNNSQILRTLFDWNWIKEAGFRDLPGRPALLITTPQFLNAFGLASLGQLPPLQNAKEAFMALDANAPKS
ncbi:TPA: SMC-Scp complex subunit ScpB [Acinetobacter baumannii]|jgi:segregation and condensation protein B|uniref:Segregation and condensation protein B n=29 Tax=Gammaproteobacteria TaxID=1236 RepID=A0ABX6CED6_ACIB2|nr:MULTISPECIES: SMC-Scp complex subunit ScpB [Acinetobacter]ADX91236.1 transcription regulator [Acinetobacter baumannii TCDC-AB0715]AHX28272.1 segregation and condensation protein B [Acinetobacter baumannii AC12]AHX65115.1 segregation and condensation protein B [Acinetobacter baumannii AC30]EMT87937.1 segregation and condensation protein B [Acinetobacter baumannii ABNIH5]EMT97795.1 segregation and condensation protein B [Acinetobacter baumannii ABNIH6]EMU08437.1 segregation and condensation 